MTPESKVKEKVKKLLDSYKPRLWYCMPAARVYGKSGVPDFIGVFHGLFFAVETKARNNKPTAMQLMQMGRIEQAQGDTFVITEDTLYKLAGWLRTVDYESNELP